MLLAEVLSPDTTITLGFVITLVVIGSGIAAGVLTSRILQGRAIKELETWRQKVMPQLELLMKEHEFQERLKREREKEDRASQSTSRGTQPYSKAGR